MSIKIFFKRPPELQDAILAMTPFLCAMFVVMGRPKDTRVSRQDITRTAPPLLWGAISAKSTAKARGWDRAWSWTFPENGIYFMSELYHCKFTRLGNPLPRLTTTIVPYEIVKGLESALSR